MNTALKFMRLKTRVNVFTRRTKKTRVENPPLSQTCYCSDNLSTSIPSVVLRSGLNQRTFLIKSRILFTRSEGFLARGPLSSGRATARADATPVSRPPDRGMYDAGRVRGVPKRGGGAASCTRYRRAIGVGRLHSA